MNKIEKWLNTEFSSGSTTGKDYLKFQREMKTNLKRQAEAAGGRLHLFNKNHYEFSAVLAFDTGNETKYIYVSICDVRFFKDQWYTSVLVRTMEHDKDWHGGRNTTTTWTQVGMHARSLIV